MGIPICDISQRLAAIALSIAVNDPLQVNTCHAPSLAENAASGRSRFGLANGSDTNRTDQ